MAIGPNKIVTLNFIMKDDKGNIIESTENAEPFYFLSGNNQILPKLEEAVDEMPIGGKKNIVIGYSNAYGEYSQKAIRLAKRTDFPENARIEIGRDYEVNSKDGKHMSFTITKIEGDNITIDFNHPLAGKNLEFEIELLDIRDPLPEELEHGHAHGSGGHHHD
jgi:FKBP-type peptidyl-prolyl cis-trans isomerase SlyD